VLRRRSPETAQEPLVAGALTLDPATHRVTADGATVPLGPTEFRLLRFSDGPAGARPFARALLDQVWGNDAYIEERTVDVHIRRLRQALEPVARTR
jgi:two-component system phosphate regulon response regulator PhoB